ncbi:hypothetical protein V1288_006547 [Bradyrhizobium sp. AZCC 2176]
MFEPAILTASIKRGADALANLPFPGKVAPQGDAAIRQRSGSRDCQPSSVKPMEVFLSNIPELSAGDSEKSFVDPWGHAPNHQGRIPPNALFLGVWERDLGITELNEALFLFRHDKRDLLWSLTTDAEKFTRESLAARASGDFYWVNSKWRCCCLAGAPRQFTEREAGRVLLCALVRARFPHEFPRPPYIPGLLSTDELTDIVRAIAEELKGNTLAAEAAQLSHEAPILKLARQLDLHPRVAGHNSSVWTADCPRRKQSIMISPSGNEFGCGYCRRKGGPLSFRNSSTT